MLDCYPLEETMLFQLEYDLYYRRQSLIFANLGGRLEEGIEGR